MPSDADRPIEELLAIRRRAERDLQESSPDDPDHAALRAIFEAAARAYQAHVDAMKDDLSGGLDGAETAT